MSKGSSKRRRKRRRRGGGGGKRGGLMIGMRSGFKDIASSVAGNPPSRKYRWVGTVLTVVVVLAALALLLGRT